MSFTETSADEFVAGLVDARGARAILDIGCGDGAHLRRLALDAPAGTRLMGIDASAATIDEALAASADDPRLQFGVLNVTAGLPFADGEFDRVMSVNVLECIPDKQHLLEEVHRVLAPDGRVVFAHFDWDSQVLDGQVKSLVRDIVHAFADWKQAWMADSDGWMGRRVWRVFQASRLFEGEMRAHVLMDTSFEPGSYGRDLVDSFEGLVRRGVVAEADYRRVVRDLEELAAAGQFFFSITMYAFVGRKRPAPPAPAAGDVSVRAAAP